MLSAADVITHLPCSCLSSVGQSAAAQIYPQSTTTNGSVHRVQHQTIGSIKYNDNIVHKVLE